jgi:hypothetical protein
MTAVVKGKRRAILRVVLKCDANGHLLPIEQQQDIYHVFSDEEPKVFICSGPTAAIAMDLARGEHDCYFEGDPEDRPEPKNQKRGPR